MRFVLCRLLEKREYSLVAMIGWTLFKEGITDTKLPHFLCLHKKFSVSPIKECGSFVPVSPSKKCGSFAPIDPYEFIAFTRA